MALYTIGEKSEKSEQSERADCSVSSRPPKFGIEEVSVSDDEEEVPEDAAVTCARL